MTFDEIIKKAGKRIKKHVYYIKNGVTTRLSDESVERIKFDLQSPLIGTSINGCELTLKEPIDGDIYVEVEAKYGEYTQTKTYGAYHLKEEATYDANKKTYLHKTFNNLLKSMVDYQPVNVSYPCTIFNFFQAIVSAIGYTTNIASLPNGNQQIQVDIFENIGFTYRDVLDDIAVANGVLFYIDGNELKVATLGGNAITIDDDVLKNQNIQFGEHFGPINTIVLSRSGESDNIYYPTTLPENPVEFKIVDNQLMNENNRDEFLPALYNQLNGIEYDIYDTELTGWGDVRPLQSVNFETGNNTYSSYIFNNEITLTDGYKQAIYNEFPEETETDYKAASKTDKTINQAYIIVRKNEAEIESLARKVVDVSKTKTSTGSIQLENAHQGILHYLSISGQISLLFPSDDLYPSNNLYPLGSYLLIDNVKYKLDFDYLRYLSATVYDEFIYEDGNCKIIRRVGIDENDQMYALENEIIEEREGIYLEVNSNSTIQLESFNNVIYKVEYLLENVYTDNFATQVDVSSQITQTENKIEETVSAVADENGNVTSASLILAINKDKSQAVINADKISLEGKEINLSAENVSIAGEVLSINNQGKMTLYDNVLNYWEQGSFTIQSIEEESRKNLITSLAVVLQDGVRYSSHTANSLDIYDEFGNTGRWQSIGLNTLFIYDDKYVPSISLADGTTRSESVTLITSRHINSPSISQTSLAEQKKNFEKLKSGLEIVKSIDIYEYNLKNQNDKSKKHIGFVIGKNFNYSDKVTSENNDGVELYSFISVCCKAIQEQQEEIENLKKEMEELKNAKN